VQVTIDGKVYNTTVTDIGMNVCAAGTACPSTTMLGNTTCAAQPAPINVVGEPCSAPANCYSGNCQNNVCKATDNGAACSNIGECNVGYYCNGNDKATAVCTKQVEFGGVCVLRTDCVNNAECVSGKCTQVYTMKVNDTIGVNTPARVCATGYESDGVCSDYLYQGTKGQYQVAATGICNYNLTSKGLIVPLVGGDCQIDGTLNVYCSHPGTNSDIWEQMISKMTAWYNGPALQKNTLRRDSTTSDIVLVAQTVTQWPKLNGANKCALSYLTGVSSNGVLAKMSIALFGLLFFLF